MLVNVQAINFNSGGNDFHDAYKKAIYLIENHMKIDTNLIFMSDGGCSYPTEEIN